MNILHRWLCSSGCWKQTVERHRFSRDRSFSRFNGTDVSKFQRFRYIDYFCRADKKFKISQTRSWARLARADQSFMIGYLLLSRGDL